MCGRLLHALVAGLLVAVLGCGTSSGYPPSPGDAAATATGLETAQQWLDRFWAAKATDTAAAAAFVSADVSYSNHADEGFDCGSRWSYVQSMATLVGADGDGVDLDQHYVDLTGALTPFGVASSGSTPTLGRVSLAELVEIDDNGVATVTHYRGTASTEEPQRPQHALVQDLARDYVEAWSAADATALRSLYDPKASLADSLVDAAVDNRDEIVELAARSGARLVLDPEAGRPAVYEYSPTPAATSTSQVVLVARSVGVCADEMAIVLEITDDPAITAERRLHSIESLQRCSRLPPEVGGWWVDRQQPTPLDERLTGAVGVGGSRVDVYNGSVRLERLVETCLDAFTAAGLMPPRVTEVTFNPYDERCAGRSGYADWSTGATSILVCIDDATVEWPTSDEDGDRGAGRAAPPHAHNVVLHELSHGWVHSNLSSTTRAAFMSLVEVTAWNDRDVAWEERGVEWAAEVITWGLLDHPNARFELGMPSCALLEKGYRLLTGGEPLTTCPTEPSIDVEITSPSGWRSLTTTYAAGCACSVRRPPTDPTTRDLASGGQ